MSKTLKTGHEKRKENLNGVKRNATELEMVTAGLHRHALS